MTTTAPPGSDLSHASPSSRPPPSRSCSARRNPSQTSRPSTAASAASASASISAAYQNLQQNQHSAQLSHNHPPSAPSQAPRHHHQRRASSSHRSATDFPPPQYDYDTTARIASHSKRSPSRDIPSSRGVVDPNTGPQRRSSSRSSHPRHHHPPDMPSAAPSGAAPPSSSHGRSSHADDKSSSHGTKQSRSRTTIPTQSGKWILGKTIGAGSMGKVKLARKEDGSEQVRASLLPPPIHHHDVPTAALPSPSALLVSIAMPITDSLFHL